MSFFSPHLNRSLASARYSANKSNNNLFAKQIGRSLGRYFTTAHFLNRLEIIIAAVVRVADGWKSEDIHAT